ncbi:hypothetical protein [Ramlibacter sp.]|uniref:hypothetical protein n=1 Tax=Ramlibacter sp. TaxID=1917967 RepID=UPI003D114FA9
MAHANSAQVIAAWSGMSENDLLILRRMAKSLLDGTNYSEPMDLMHEALIRTLDGRRNWAQGVPFSVFLGNAMRSIASAERSHRGRVRVDFDDFVAEMDAVECAPSAEHEAIALQQVAMTQKVVDALRQKLAGDEAAQKVLSGIAAGLSPAEIREALNMDQHAYEAARKRISRRLKLAQMH